MEWPLLLVGQYVVWRQWKYVSLDLEELLMAGRMQVFLVQILNASKDQHYYFSGHLPHPSMQVRMQY